MYTFSVLDMKRIVFWAAVLLYGLGWAASPASAQDNILPQSVLSIDSNIQEAFSEHVQLTGVSLSLPDGYEAVQDIISIGSVTDTEGVPPQLMTCRFFFRSPDHRT